MRSPPFYDATLEHPQLRNFRLCEDLPNRTHGHRQRTPRRFKGRGFCLFVEPVTDVWRGSPAGLLKPGSPLLPRVLFKNQPGPLLNPQVRVCFWARCPTSWKIRGTLILCGPSTQPSRSRSQHRNRRAATVHRCRRNRPTEQSATPAGTCIEPWLSHLRFGELEGGRRDDLGDRLVAPCWSAFSR